MLSAGGIRASQHLFSLVSPNDGVCLSTKDQTSVSEQLIVFQLRRQLEQLVAQRNGVVGHDDDVDVPSSVTPDPWNIEPYVSPWSAICVFGLIQSACILLWVECWYDTHLIRSGSETYLTEDPLSSQQFGAQADYKAQHC